MHRVRMLENNWQSGNAIGFAVRREKDKIYVGHGGSYFGYKTQTYMQLEPKVGVIVLTNEDDANPADIALHLMQSVGEAVAKAGAVPAKTISWDPSWSRFAGKYRSRIGGETEVIEMDKRLVTIDPSGLFPETPNQLEPLGNGLFRLDGASGGGPVGETVRFIEQNGVVTRMYTGGSYAERVAAKE